MIDRVYIVCNRSDAYLAKVCMASIRHWNESIPISIIKDNTKGDFNLGNVNLLNIDIADTSLYAMGYYSKLYPFIENNNNERIMLLDADTAWMCDMSALLMNKNEDLLIDGYVPENTDAEMKRWYFDPEKLKAFDPEYVYPGFLFNVGQLVCDTNVFGPEDLLSLIQWKNDPVPTQKDLFFYEQGMLNYIAAKKIGAKTITYKITKMHRWGWNNEILELKKEDFNTPKPYLIHWYGKKWGLLSILPGADILKAYEKEFYQRMRHGLMKMYWDRFVRILKSPVRYSWHFTKKILFQK